MWLTLFGWVGTVIGWFAPDIGRWVVRRLGGGDEVRRLGPGKEYRPGPIVTARRTTERFSFIADPDRSVVEHRVRFEGFNTTDPRERTDFRYDFRCNGGEEQKIDLRVIECDKDHTAVIKWVHPSRNPFTGEVRYEAELEITGSLGPGLSGATFEFSERVVDAFCRTFEEAVEAYTAANCWPHEYASDTTRIPTDELLLEVTFTEQDKRWLEIEPGPVIFADGLNEVVDEKLTRRIRNRKGSEWDWDMQKGVAWLRLKAPNPHMGHAIEWMPPKADTVNSGQGTSDGA